MSPSWLMSLTWSLIGRAGGIGQMLSCPQEPRYPGIGDFSFTLSVCDSCAYTSTSMVCTTAAARGASHWVPPPFALDGESLLSFLTLTLQTRTQLRHRLWPVQADSDGRLSASTSFDKKAKDRCNPHGRTRFPNAVKRAASLLRFGHYPQCTPYVWRDASNYRGALSRHMLHHSPLGRPYVQVKVPESHITYRPRWGNHRAQSVNKKGDTTCSTRVRVGRLCHTVSWDGLSGSFRLEPKQSSHPTGLAQAWQKRVLSVPDATVPPPRAPDETYSE
ncbi:hypothetical protein LZ31DRAFT_339410 [Colletotrichum somersetense]|nr:hypothetical protein LZ31DRAFT_339410 [Colletotrichum somersetense]